jgi:hypothetical protein
VVPDSGLDYEEDADAAGDTSTEADASDDDAPADGTVILTPCGGCGHFGTRKEIFFRRKRVKIVEALTREIIDVAEKYVLTMFEKKPPPREPYRCFDDIEVQNLCRFVLNAKHSKVSCCCV